MTRIRYRSIPQWATLVVFGMLLLRALVPAGFMLAPVDGHLAFVLCEPGVMASGNMMASGDAMAPDMMASGDAMAPDMMASGDAMASMDHQHHHDHHHPGNDLAAHHGAHPDPTCPYAQSAGSAPLPSLPVLTAGPIPDRLAAPPAVTQTRLTFGPPRQQTSRGPPSLA
jgi:hypothetical protein